MKITSICNQKGGVGKTTTCANLAADLVRAGRRVLCIDFDPQANLTEYLGHVPDDGPTITELLMAAAQRAPLEPMTAVRRSEEGVDFIPSSIKLAGAELFLAQAMFREQMLKHTLSFPSLEVYDHIIIDCLPSLGILLTNALVVSNDLLVPVQAQNFSLLGLDDLINTVNISRLQANPELRITGVLLTMANKTYMRKAVETALRERYPELTYETTISYSVEATNSTYAKHTLVNDSTSKLGEQYRALVQEFLGRENCEN